MSWYEDYLRGDIKRLICCIILVFIKKAEPFSLIHAHFGQNRLAALKLKEKYNVPVITSFYEYDSGRLSKSFIPYYIKLLQMGDIFLALSEDMKSDLKNLGFPAHKIKIRTNNYFTELKVGGNK